MHATMKINSIRQYLTTNAVETLVQPVVTSRLNYCNSTYIGLPTTTTHKLQLSHNAAALVTNSGLYIQALHNEAPISICDLLPWYHPNRPLRSANRISLVPHRHKTVKVSRRLMDTAAATFYGTISPTTLETVIIPGHLRNFEDLSIPTITCYLIAFTVHRHIMLLYTVLFTILCTPLS